MSNEIDLPADYGTPAYEARWIREKLNLPADCKSSVVQGAMHVQESHAHGYEAYITAYRCDDKQGEIARQSVTIEEQAAEIAALRARLGRFDSMKIANLEVENAKLRTRLLTAAGDDLCRLSQEEIKAYTNGAVPIPPRCEFIASCERFHAQIAGTAGVNQNCLTSAQMAAEITRLETELKKVSP